MAYSLGEKLRGLREAKGWTLQYLSSRAGIDKSQLSRYEKDANDPSATSLRALASALDVRVGYLFDEIPELQSVSLVEVAVREALRLFLSNKKLSPTVEKRYWSAIDLPAAPRTLQGWNELEELLHRMMGHK